jgi:hypothetical protein
VIWSYAYSPHLLAAFIACILIASRCVYLWSRRSVHPLRRRLRHIGWCYLTWIKSVIVALETKA